MHRWNVFQHSASIVSGLGIQLKKILIFTDLESCVFSSTIKQWLPWRAPTLGHNSIYARPQTGSFLSRQIVSLRLVVGRLALKAVLADMLHSAISTGAETVGTAFALDASDRSPPVDCLRIIRHTSAALQSPSATTASVASGISRNGDRSQPVFRGYAILHAPRSPVCCHSSANNFRDLIKFGQHASGRHSNPTVSSLSPAAWPHEAIKI